MKPSGRCLAPAPVRRAWSGIGSNATPLTVALLTLLTFAPSLWNDFVAWDDWAISSNPAFQGLGLAQLRWMFTTFLAGHYMPLTWLTFSVDHAIWGVNPVGFHLTNVLLHAANGVLVYLLARRLLGRSMELPLTALDVGAGAAALFFAIHPLRAESVAWVTERRDVLSGLFFLLTILVYLHASEAEGRRRRWLLSASVAAYLLAVASKEIVMTIPLILVLLDVYPLRRLAGPSREWLRAPQRAVWLEKLPFLVLGLLAAGMAYYVTTLKRYAPPETSLWAGASAAVYSLWFYVYKTLLPFRLSPLYELPARMDPLAPPFVASALGVTAITAGTVLLRRNWPAGLASWLSYAILLAPVSGIVHSGLQIAADRFSYLSCLGWAFLAGAGVSLVVRARERGRYPGSFLRWTAGLVPILFVGLTVLTWQQVRVWRDSESLWRHAVTATPECAVCHTNLAVSLMGRGSTLSALEHFNLALGLRPDLTQARLGAGLALARLGLPARAVEQYERVLSRHPDAAVVRNHLAEALLQMGRPTAAREQLERAERVSPNHPGIQVNLGFALSQAGAPADAVRHFRRALVLQADHGMARLGLIQSYLALGEIERARQEYEVLRAADPALASRIDGAVGLEH